MTTAVKELHSLRVMPGTLAAVGAQASGKGMLQTSGSAFSGQLPGKALTLTQWHAEQEAGLAAEQPQRGGFAKIIARSRVLSQTPPVEATEPVRGFAGKLRLPSKRR